MKKHISLAMAAVATVATITAAYGHHSFSMFDPAQQIAIEGKVIRWAFTSPHSFMIMEDADGVTWAFEGQAPPNLIGRNMKGDTFTPGQPITMIMCPLRDGRNGGAAGIIITEDGTIFNPSDGGCPGPNSNAAKWPEWLEKGYKSLEEALAAEPAATQ